MIYLLGKVIGYFICRVKKHVGSVGLRGISPETTQMWFATVADGVMGPGKRPPPPSEIKPFLLEIFGGWHDPVASLLRGTEDKGILWEDARAMSSRDMKLIASSRLAGKERGGGRGEGVADKNASAVGVGMVLVGDAAHTVRRILTSNLPVPSRLTPTFHTIPSGSNVSIQSRCRGVFSHHPA